MKRYRAFPILTSLDSLIIRPKYHVRILIAVLLVMVISSAGGWAKAISDNVTQTENPGAERVPVQVNGVFPNLTVIAKGTGSDSEAGIGALIPWAEKLWAIGYVAHIRGV